MITMAVIFEKGYDRAMQHLLSLMNGRPRMSVVTCAGLAGTFLASAFPRFAKEQWNAPLVGLHVHCTA